MKRLQEKPETYFAAAAKMLDTEGMSDAAALLRRCTINVEETGFDNWNGGTKIWTVFLKISPTEFAKLGVKKQSMEEQISVRLKPIVEQFTSDWYNVTIAPDVSPEPDWTERKEEVPSFIRQNILDGLKIDNIMWFGQLDDVEFLGRIYDLEALPSYDSRYSNASGDIWQHRFNNDDWDVDWVYGDSRFNLVHGSTETFLKFLCEMVHPLVRPNRNEALKLVGDFNDQLRQVGWNLVEVERIAGRPRFSAQPAQLENGRSVSRARTVADALNASWMQKEIERLENAVESDPALAIGTAKELVESCCKTILDRKGIEVPKSADLPKLTKMVTTELKLVPEGISDEVRGAETIKLILRNLSALTQYLAELRGMYGSGHGRDGKHRGLQPRHARLAVGAAVAFIDFISATYHKQSGENTD